jgi:hypothetical protein
LHGSTDHCVAARSIGTLDLALERIVYRKEAGCSGSNGPQRVGLVLT